mgnify:CR=1 FL=1
MNYLIFLYTVMCTSVLFYSGCGQDESARVPKEQIIAENRILDSLMFDAYKNHNAEAASSHLVQSDELLWVDALGNIYRGYDANKKWMRDAFSQVEQILEMHIEPVEYRILADSIVSGFGKYSIKMKLKNIAEPMEISAVYSDVRKKIGNEWKFFVIEETMVQQQMLYVCPMHPEIISDKAESCPKCGMALIERK